MEPIVWLVIAAVVAVVAVAIVVALVNRRSPSTQLRHRFGPEYDRAVRRAGSRKAAEEQLSGIAARRDALDIRPLDRADRMRLAEQWDAVQTRFVDHPASSLASAESLVLEVLDARGYPVAEDDDFDERVALVATDHPDVTEEYRVAEDLHSRVRDDDRADTEDLRQSFVHYRSLFQALLETPAVPDTPESLAADADRRAGRDLTGRELSERELEARR